MNRFTNPVRKEYHNSAISDFSDMNRPAFSGCARAYTIERQSWIADFLFKSIGNVAINKHVGALSFFSDYEIFKSEYGNISDLSANYTFLSEYERELLSIYSFELTTGQYHRIGQDSSESDVVEYFNKSRMYKFDEAHSQTSFEFVHEFTRLPSYYAMGYVFPIIDSGTNSHYRRYVFADHEQEMSTIQDYSDLLTTPLWKADINSYSNSVIEDEAEGAIDRIINTKLDVENPEFFYYDPHYGDAIYYNNSQHYSERKYSPYLLASTFYNLSWSKVPTTYGAYFFPEIIFNGALEPAKIIPLHTEGILSEDRCAVNNLCHNGEADDQSRIVYSACKNMTVYDSVSAGYKICILNPNDSSIISEGIDVETERNRRYAATVMTEPYFVTEPICGGKVCYYTFVGDSGAPVYFDHPMQFLYHPRIYLKIKATSDVISEIDRLLALNETNDDIIDTITITQTVASEEFPSSAEYINNFYDSAHDFLKRQDCGLDDLHGELKSERSYTVYTIPAIGNRALWYSDSKMKVSGIGFLCTHEVVAGGAYEEKQYVNIYCNNFKPTAAYAYADSDTDPEPVTNKTVELIDNDEFVRNIRAGERFKPMIKLVGINGYVKIMERDRKFEVTRSADGLTEVVYAVEFPYAPGSYTERSKMKFSSSDPYKPTFILYKKAHIAAGSSRVYGQSEPPPAI